MRPFEEIAALRAELAAKVEDYNDLDDQLHAALKRAERAEASVKALIERAYAVGFPASTDPIITEARALLASTELKEGKA